MDRGSKGIFISQIAILLLIFSFLFARWINLPEEKIIIFPGNSGYELEYGPYEKININIADIDRLKMITGVGDVLAKRIIEFRERKGNFSGIDDLEKVNGIGEKKKEVLKKFVIFR